MTYTVVKGDTLTKIAKKFNVSVEALVVSNWIENPDRITVGQVLTIPENKPTNNQLYNAFITCLDAIENLPEFRQLEALLNG